ncbi:MAG: ATP-binding protein [Gammaproteobacteria bacterium]|jgi:Cdc6-like AAA superfamily ATPase|nr:ATP-binding protein [Gammaproteobacteria bacterium]
MNKTLPEAAESLIAAIISDGVQQDTKSLIIRSRQLASKLRNEHPGLAEKIGVIVASTPTRGSGGPARPIPVDADSRQKLLREEYPVLLDSDPIWPPDVSEQLQSLIVEQTQSAVLEEAGLTPIRSLLMTGPPGCGKTTTAGWIASQLDLPLLTLDLATVMSSYLGKTGSNVRAVLEHAQDMPCVLLLDEFDAIAKRRDDDSDVGELKRLVTVLLQAIDDWPSGSLLVAATNHGELLDPAVWRRFDLVIEFPAPTEAQIANFLKAEIDPFVAEWLSQEIKPESIALLKNSMKLIRKKALLEKRDLNEVLVEQFKLHITPSELEYIAKERSVIKLSHSGLSQRKISELTGLSRPVVKKIQENICQGE